MSAGIFGLILVLAVSTLVPAGKIKCAPPAVNSIHDYVSASGQIDLEAIRRTGFQGPIDLQGTKVRVDSRSGQSAVSSFSATETDDPDDVYWDNSASPSLSGLNGTGNCMIVFEDRLVIGGWFTVAGDVVAHRIVAWDGTSLTPLGDGFDRGVYALTIYNGKLVAGGVFEFTGTQQVGHVAVWDDSTWSPLGTGVSGDVYALAVFNSELIVGGEFSLAGGQPASNIAKWNGSVWSALGSGVDESVWALAVYGGELIAGGVFQIAGGGTASLIAKWNGTVWSPLGTGVNGDFIYESVHNLQEFDGKLAVAGSFDSAGAQPAKNLAFWDGSVWTSANSDPAVNFTIRDFCIFENRLILAGHFDSVNGNPPRAVMSWDGSQWYQTGNSTLSEIGEVVGAFQNRLFLGGFVHTDWISPDSPLEMWDGATWSQLEPGTGLNGSVYALGVYHDELIVGGSSITTAGGIDVSGIASWDGSTWSTLGSGLGNPAEAIFALTVWNDLLIAGGMFLSIGGESAISIAAWNGTEWAALGSGLDTMGSPLDTRVDALSVYDGKLIAGGQFILAGDSVIRGVAAWDGITWTSLGEGVDGPVYALETYGGQLAVGGAFDSAGGIEAKRIALWDGSNWSALGSGINDSISQVAALTVFEGNLVAGGAFNSVGGVPAPNVATWNGSTWSSVGNTPIQAVTGLRVFDDKLFAAGYTQDTSGVTCWNGSEWVSLGSGTDWVAWRLNEFNNKLVVGGDFSIAGKKVAPRLAFWTKRTLTDIVDADPLLPSPLTLSQNYPNPFNPSTTIKYSLPQRSHVRIEIVNLLGQTVRTLVNVEQAAGQYRVVWDGRDDGGTALATGVYLYRLHTDDRVESRKMVLIK